MRFMVIEKFRNQDARTVYQRFREKGRLTPEGLAHVSSWVAADLSRCFQLMDCEDIRLFQQWVSEWSDSVEFEIIPVVAGADTAKTLLGQDTDGTQPVSSEYSPRTPP